MSVEEHADSDSERVSRPRPPLAGRPKVMIRPRSGPDNDLQGKPYLMRPRKTLEEKEAEYEAARARIFGLDTDAGPEGPCPMVGAGQAGSISLPGAAAMDDPQRQGCGGRLEMKAVMKKPDEQLDPDYNRNIRWHIGGYPAGGVNGTGSGAGIINGGLLAGGWARPANVRRAPSGPHLPRELVSQRRMTGSVLEWKGKYGWIQPTEPVQHPKARIHQGRIFVSMIDLVDGESLENGAAVEFYLFHDAAGLGAEECAVVGRDATDLAKAVVETGRSAVGSAIAAAAEVAPGSAEGELAAASAEPAPCSNAEASEAASEGIAPASSNADSIHEKS